MRSNGARPGKPSTPGEAVTMLAHGWQQVEEWKDWLAGSIADSQQNLEELLQRGYNPAYLAEIPLLVDLERLAPLAGAYPALRLGPPWWRRRI